MKISAYLSDGLGKARCMGLQFNDLAALLAGVKDVVYTGILGKDDRDRLDALCAGLKLQKVQLPEKKGVFGMPADYFLIGPSMKKLRRAEKAYSDVMSAEWGLALGYPECCVKSYLSWSRKKDLIFHILAGSPSGRLFPFWMNNVTNYYSRLGLLPSDRRNYEAFAALNRGADYEPVIPWHPCSYLCRETLDKGRKIFALLERYMPATAAFRKAALSRPLVFQDKFRFLALNGECGERSGGFEVPYDGTAGPHSLFPAGLERKIRLRRRLNASSRGRIKKPAGISFPAGCVLIPFSR